MTILAEIYGDPILFGSGLGFNRTRSDPGFVNPIRSGPGFVIPIRSVPGFVNALARTHVQINYSDKSESASFFLQVLQLF